MKEPMFSPRNYSKDVFYVPGDENNSMLGAAVTVERPEDLLFRVVDWFPTSFTDDDGDEVMMFVPIVLRVNPENPAQSIMPAMLSNGPGVICYSLKEAVAAANASWERLQREREEFVLGIAPEPESEPTPEPEV